MPNEVPSEAMRKILTSPTGQRMISYNTTGIYRDSYVGLWLYQVLGLEMDEIARWIEELPGQRFPDFVTWGIRWWEEAYALPVDESLTLEERRARLRTRGRAGGPVNPARLEKVVKDATGFHTEIQEHVAPYTFRVNVYPEGQNVVDMYAVYRLLRSRKQSHKSMYISFNVESSGKILVGAYSSLAVRMSSYPFQKGQISQTAQTHIGSTIKYGIVLTAYPWKGVR